MAAVTRGVPGNFERPLYPDVNRIEMVSQVSPLPNGLTLLAIDPTILTFDSGAHGVVGGRYPSQLEDGLFLAVADPAKLTQSQLNALNIEHTDFFDYAAGKTSIAPVWMVFSNNTAVIVGAEHRPTTYNTGVNPYTPNFTANANPSPNDLDPTYAPAYAANPKMGSQGVSGLQGVFSLWIHAGIAQEASLVGYTKDVELTINKGRFQIAVAGDIVKAVVERIYTHTTGSIKAKVRVDTSSLRVKV